MEPTTIVLGGIGALLLAAVLRLGVVAAAHDRRLSRFEEDKDEVERHVSFLARQQYRTAAKPASFDDRASNQFEAAVDSAIDAIEKPRFLKKAGERQTTIKRPAAIDQAPGVFAKSPAEIVGIGAPAQRYAPDPAITATSNLPLVSDQIDQRALAARIDAVEKALATVSHSLRTTLGVVAQNTRAIETRGAGVGEGQLNTAKAALRTEIDLLNNRVLALQRTVNAHIVGAGPAKIDTPAVAGSSEPATA
jgi:hypothetical protein